MYRCTTSAVSDAASCVVNIAYTSNRSVQLLFIHCRICCCTSSHIFDFLITGIDTIIIKGHTTNSDLIKAYIIFSSNFDFSASIGNCNVLTIYKVNSIPTRYSCCTRAVGLNIPRCRRFCQVFDARFTIRTKIG